MTRQRLLSVEGHAVGALVHSGIALMGAHQNGIQRAVVLGAAVVGALLYGAFDALVGMAVHRKILLAFYFIWNALAPGNSLTQNRFEILVNCGTCATSANWYFYIEFH